MAVHVMIHIKPEDLPENGIKVLFRCGECFDNQIEWGEISEGVLKPSSSCNDKGEPGIIIDEPASLGFAGFEARTGNYWRYINESDPEVFREFCLQIIEIQERFSPRSSWGAWSATTETVNQDMIRLSLKNDVTGAEVGYKVIAKGFGYQVKDLGNGRRVQKLLRHDYILNQILGTSFKHLNYKSLNIETDSIEDDEAGASISLYFKDNNLLLKYQVNEYDFSLGLFDCSGDTMELVKLIELPHSRVIESTCTFLG